jgi:hypothetical protein
MHKHKKVLKLNSEPIYSTSKYFLKHDESKYCLTFEKSKYINLKIVYSKVYTFTLYEIKWPQGITYNGLPFYVRIHTELRKNSSLYTIKIIS